MGLYLKNKMAIVARLLFCYSESARYIIQRWEVILVSQRKKKQVGIGKFMRESASNAGQFVERSWWQ